METKSTYVQEHFGKLNIMASFLIVIIMFYDLVYWQNRIGWCGSNSEYLFGLTHTESILIWDAVEVSGVWVGVG